MPLRRHTERYVPASCQDGAAKQRLGLEDPHRMMPHGQVGGIASVPPCGLQEPSVQRHPVAWNAAQASGTGLRQAAGIVLGIAETGWLEPCGMPDPQDPVSGGRAPPQGGILRHVLDAEALQIDGMKGRIGSPDNIAEHLHGSADALPVMPEHAVRHVADLCLRGIEPLMERQKVGRVAAMDECRGLGMGNGMQSILR